MINMCLDDFIGHLFLFMTYLSSPVFQNKAKLHVHVCNFGWPFNRCKENRKTLIAMTKRWPQPLNRGGQLIGVLFAVFY